ncbi:Tap42 interacting protein [Microbotryomycetes sp. JL201]|nr:Tap42 interacting protein [Microbotryomycetes sp. JL201]
MALHATRSFNYGSVKGISIGSWTVSSTKKPIMNAQECDDASAQLHCPLPEICFGNNLLSVKDSESGLEMRWSMLPALQQVARDTAVKVAHASTWGRGQAAGGNSDVKVQKPYDWTYTTAYTGDVTLSKVDLPKPRPPPQFEPAPASHPGIPLHTLARTDIPILFYDEVPLFEDELGDNGSADLTCRVISIFGTSKRVNSHSAFILSRFFLRIDLVLFRVFDVRTYFDFQARQVIRESRGRQASYNTIKRRIPLDKRNDLTMLTDANWVASQLDALAATQTPTSAKCSGQTTSLSRLAGAPVGRIPLNASAASSDSSASVESLTLTDLPVWDAEGSKLELLHL